MLNFVAIDLQKLYKIIFKITRVSFSWNTLYIGENLYLLYSLKFYNHNNHLRKRLRTSSRCFFLATELDPLPRPTTWCNKSLEIVLTLLTVHARYRQTGGQTGRRKSDLNSGVYYITLAKNKKNCFVNTVYICKSAGKLLLKNFSESSVKTWGDNTCR